MRVWFVGIDHDVTYSLADHWEMCGNWVELYDAHDNLIAILNWKHVTRIEMMP